MKVYSSLYDWQKVFAENSPQKYFTNKFGEERAREALGEYYGQKVDSIDKIGYFLRMGTGKTKITVAKAELNDADCVFVTSLRSKVVAGEEEGEFGWELRLAGYKVYYAHKAFDENGEFTIRGLDSKKTFKDFEEDVKSGNKIAYVFNHEHIITKKGYQRLTYLALNYNNITWIIDEAHKIANFKAEVATRVYNMLYSWSTPDVVIKLNPLKKERKEAEALGNMERVEELNQLERLARGNVFKNSIKGFYLATGTPNSKGYQSFYGLLSLLGHNWCYNGVTIEDGEVVKKSLTGYAAFFEEFCIEDTWVKKFNPFARAIKGYKNIEKLLDIVQQYAFFAKTENYFDGMPSRLVEIAWIPRHESYKQMTDPNKKNPHYRVLDGYICDTPALLGLRARQLASGFMGNAEHADYYHANKTLILQEILESNPDNYIIFYNFTPELELILSAAEDAGYNIDIYNGIEKSLDNYRKVKGIQGEKNLLVANVASGSAALNLQKYSNVIFFALPDMFRDYDQAIGRVERIGQKAKEVSVINFVTKGTVEEKVWQQLKEGQSYTNTMYDRDIVFRDLK